MAHATALIALWWVRGQRASSRCEQRGGDAVISTGCSDEPNEDDARELQWSARLGQASVNATAGHTRIARTDRLALIVAND